MWGVPAKLRGDAEGCPWRRIFSIYDDNLKFQAVLDSIRPAITQKDYDAALDIDLLESPKRAFWIPRQGSTRPGKELLPYLLAEQDWLMNSSSVQVRKGDIVLDCGGHVGVFTNKALEMGAAKVVAIEPNPVNIECLRRNFAAEIATGRVVVMPKGVWDVEKTITLYLAVKNSGMGSMIHEQGGGAIEVPVTTIDKMVQELGLPRVDFIKMDIEGAEREALRGAMETLRHSRPRLMLDSYHEPDDMTVLPSIIHEAHANYATVCGPCQTYTPEPKRLVPHTTFYE
jgi:FkbM family methyltransferase